MADETLIAGTGETETTTTTADTTTETQTLQTGQTEQQQTETGKTTQTETTTEAPAYDFAKDWRAALSKGDSDLGKFLGRYQSPDAAIKQLKTLNDDIKNGKYRKPLGDDATPEEIAAHRKEQGIPEKPEGYLEKLPEGLVIGDVDKPAVDKFLAAMHESGAPPSQVNAALETYYDIVQEQAEAQSELIETSRREGEDALALEWGADKKRNLNAVKAFVAGLPKEVGEALSGGFIRRDDGMLVPMGNSPEFVKWLAGLALEANPLATVVPGAGANQASAVADEIADIEKLMGDRGSDYWKGPKAEKMQERYRELIDARAKLAAKA